MNIYIPAYYSLFFLIFLFLQHFEPEAMEYDRIRTGFIEPLGIHVMRFTNLDAKQSFEGVCAAITNNLKRQPPPSADGTPRARRGQGWNTSCLSKRSMTTTNMALVTFVVPNSEFFG